MAQTMYTLACMSINGTQINQVQEQGFDLGLGEIVQSSDGMIDPTYSAIMSAKPKFSFKTTDIAGILAIAAFSPVNITANVIAYYQQITAQGLRASGSVHRSATIAAGMVVLRRISTSQNASAVAEFDIIALSADGLADAIVLANNVALPTLTGTAVMFTLGPLKIAATMYDGLQSFDMDIGLKDVTIMHSGLVYPTRAHCEQRLPHLRWKHNDASLIAILGQTGLAASGSCVQFLRKMTAQGTRVANITTQHIGFTITKGIYKPLRLAGGNPKEQVIDLDLNPVYDGTNAIVAVSTAIAIS